jgi:hypothetical protein
LLNSTPLATEARHPRTRESWAMALINCRECGREVSSSAQSCPNCGFPQAPVKTLDVRTDDAPNSPTRLGWAGIAGGVVAASSIYLLIDQFAPAAREFTIENGSPAWLLWGAMITLQYVVGGLVTVRYATDRPIASLITMEVGYFVLLVMLAGVPGITSFWHLALGTSLVAVMSPVVMSSDVTGAASPPMPDSIDSRVARLANRFSQRVGGNVGTVGVTLAGLLILAGAPDAILHRIAVAVMEARIHDSQAAQQAPSKTLTSATSSDADLQAWVVGTWTCSQNLGSIGTEWHKEVFAADGTFSGFLAPASANDWPTTPLMRGSWIIGRGKYGDTGARYAYVELSWRIDPSSPYFAGTSSLTDRQPIAGDHLVSKLMTEARSATIREEIIFRVSLSTK